ncbi:MAG: hypothetical protein AMK69_03270 [Nitrospira bacterium SG8_3]|nr:MAG: hypothetical protein AMK69_03270 [Nitrospira bacterium SG8_3]
MIDACSFGIIVIDGIKHTSDLLITPDGRIVEPWWRKSGHRLSSDDIRKLIESEPECIIAGTGISGQVRPEKTLEKTLLQRGIRFIAAQNHDAMKYYNEISHKKRVGACFHLTC